MFSIVSKMPRKSSLGSDMPPDFVGMPRIGANLLRPHWMFSKAMLWVVSCVIISFLFLGAGKKSDTAPALRPWQHCQIILPSSDGEV